MRKYYASNNHYNNGFSAPGCWRDLIIEVVHSYISSDELLRAIRKFLMAWAQTEEGRQAKKETCDNFNWGDFAEWSATLQGRIPGISNITYIYPDIKGKRTAVVLDHEELHLANEGAADENTYNINKDVM
jgi:hypothetical protein